jgi:type VI secretion system protein ImpH
MSPTKRRIDADLIDYLREEPYRFEFFQAVRLLLGRYRQNSSQHDQDVLGRVIQFRSSVSLAFPPSEIESLEFELDTDDPETAFKRVTLTPAFIGLTGPLGVMPRHYTQYVAERETYHRDRATRAFLDIFTSRAVAIFYQSWLKYKLHLQYEADRNKHFLPLVLGLAGLSSKDSTSRVGLYEEFSPETLAYYAGPLRERPQSVQWFPRIVTDHFGMPCHAEQFVGQWMDFPSEELTCLGSSHCALGVETFCGGRYWDRQSKVRVTIGPMRKAQFEDFLPGGKAGKKIGLLFRLMVGATFDCEVRLKLDCRDIDAAALRCDAGPARLGFSAWLTSCPITRDAQDTAYLLQAEDTY